MGPAPLRCWCRPARELCKLYHMWDGNRNRRRISLSVARGSAPALVVLNQDGCLDSRVLMHAQSELRVPWFTSLCQFSGIPSMAIVTNAPARDSLALFSARALRHSLVLRLYFFVPYLPVCSPSRSRSKSWFLPVPACVCHVSVACASAGPIDGFFVVCVIPVR